MAEGMIGAPIRRTEDFRFLTGQGHYLDDINRPNQTHAYFLRSPHAHAKIRGIDTAAATSAPGVVAVLTGADIAADKVGGLICGWVVTDRHGQPHKAPPHPAIAAPFVNTPFATVTLSKVWVDAFAGDQANLSIGGAAAGTGTSTAPTNDQVVQVAVAPGSALTLSEVLPGGNTGLYTSTLACVGAPVSNNTGTGGAIMVPAYPASTAGIQCTFTNTAVRKTVTLE